MNRKNLLFVPKVYNDESLVSYIYRLDNENNYDKAWIFELLGIDLSKIRTHGFQLGNEKIDTSILAEMLIIGCNNSDLGQLISNKIEKSGNVNLINSTISDLRS